MPKGLCDDHEWAGTGDCPHCDREHANFVEHMQRTAPKPAVRVIRITKCDECPHCVRGGTMIPTCHKQQRSVPYTIKHFGLGTAYPVVLDTVPEWCPLERAVLG